MNPLYVPRNAQKPGLWPGGRIGEIYRDPPNAAYPLGDYRLWVGTATIERSADYSYFPQAERLHILLDGDGLDLHFRQPDAVVALRTGEWHTFSGERPLRAHLLGAAVSAFNLIYRAGMCSSARFVDLGAAGMGWRGRAVDGVRLTQIAYVLPPLLPAPGPEPQMQVEGAQGRFLLGPEDTLIWDLTGPDERELCLFSPTPARLLLVEVADGPPQPTTSA